MPRISKNISTNDLYSLYQSGLSLNDVAERFGVCSEAIRSRFLRNGLKIRSLSEAGLIFNARNLSFDRDEAIRLYRDGALFVDLAERFNVHWMVVRRVIINAGVKLRPYSEIQRIKASRLTKQERARHSKAAHDAVRGKSQSLEHRRKIALTREDRGVGISRIELSCKNLLEDRGFTCIPQKAIGSYNVDVAITEPPIAVEIFGGHWHAHGSHAARFRKRIDYIINSGWHPIIIWVTRDYPLEIGAIEYIVSFAKKISGNKSFRCKEQMIFGNGQVTSLGKRKLNGLPVISRPHPRNKATGRYTPLSR